MRRVEMKNLDFLNSIQADICCSSWLLDWVSECFSLISQIFWPSISPFPFCNMSNQGEYHSQYMFTSHHRLQSCQCSEGITFIGCYLPSCLAFWIPRIKQYLDNAINCDDHTLRLLLVPCIQYTSWIALPNTDDNRMMLCGITHMVHTIYVVHPNYRLIKFYI